MEYNPDKHHHIPPQQLPRSPSRTIGSIVHGFKIGVTKWFDHSVWQRNYYEHIIRSTEEYERIANYIINNPVKWREDKFFKLIQSSPKPE